MFPTKFAFADVARALEGEIADEDVRRVFNVHIDSEDAGMPPGYVASFDWPQIGVHNGERFISFGVRNVSGKICAQVVMWPGQCRAWFEVTEQNRTQEWVVAKLSLLTVPHRRSSYHLCSPSKKSFVVMESKEE